MPILSRRSLLGMGSMALLSLSACSKGRGCRTGASVVKKNDHGTSHEPGVPGSTTPLTHVTHTTDVEELARQIVKTERDAVFDIAATAIRAGATHETLLTAACLAGVSEISPWQPGGKLHAVMAIESAFQIAQDLDKPDALRLALWCIDDFKASQQHDIDEGDWKLEPAPNAPFSDIDAARKELASALTGWDPERADRSVVGLVRLLGKGEIDDEKRDAVFEVIWPFMARSFTGAGHKAIHVSLLERALRRMGWRHAEPILRTMVMVMLAQPGSKGTESYDLATPRLRELKDGWLEGKHAPEESMAIVRRLRHASMREAQSHVIDAFSNGLSPSTVWDGLRLFAAELFLRRERSRPADTGRALFPVHGVTVNEAVGHAFRRTSIENTKRLLMLQAAGFVITMRDTFVERVNLRKDGPWLDSLDPNESVNGLDELLEDPTPVRTRGFLEQNPDNRKALRKALSRFVASKTVEHHQLKYAAAMLGESERVDARWASHIVAPALPYVPMPADPQTKVGECMERALQNAGVL